MGGGLGRPRKDLVAESRGPRVPVSEVDPLVCPRCAGTMKSIAFIAQSEVIAKILVHLGPEKQILLAYHLTLLLSHAWPHAISP